MSWLNKYFGEEQRPDMVEHDIQNFLRWEHGMRQQQSAQAPQTPAEETPAPASYVPESGVEPAASPAVAPVPMAASAPRYAQMPMGVPGQQPRQKYMVDPNLQLDPDKALNAIFGNEGGKIGQRTQLKGKDGRQATALGRYQIVQGTREGIRKEHFKQFSKEEFDRLYRTDPEFEYAVARAHMTDLIKAYGSKALGAWYSPKYVAENRWDEVPGKEWGNKDTLRQYHERAMKRYGKLQYGGEGDPTEPLKPNNTYRRANYTDQLGLPKSQTLEADRTLGGAHVVSDKGQQIAEQEWQLEQHRKKMIAANPHMLTPEYAEQRRQEQGYVNRDGDFIPYTRTLRQGIRYTKGDPASTVNSFAVSKTKRP